MVNMSLGRCAMRSELIFMCGGAARRYTCGPRPPPPPRPCGQECTPPQPPCCGRQVRLPPDCRAAGNVPPNPCMPIYHHGKQTWKRFRNLFLFIGLPVIILQTLNCMQHCPPHKTECRDFEYMRRRTKRFPWGNGNETFFHNPDVNFLPGECDSTPIDDECEDE